jgi:large subunit ribosomal protein L4
MAKVTVYNLEGKKVKDLELNKDIFEVEVKEEVIHKVVKAHLAKPWKQKGTGRARHGSNRSPIWIGGGVTFGPSSSRNFKQKINKKEKKKALLMTLSSKLSDKKLIIVDEFKMEKISTKKFIKNISKLPVKDNKVLLVLDKKDDKIIKSIKNIPTAKSTNTGSLNIYDMLKYDSLLMTISAVDSIEKNYKK